MLQDFEAINCGTICCLLLLGMKTLEPHAQSSLVEECNLCSFIENDSHLL